MKWTITLPYTHTTTNSRFVKRQINSREICKGLYGKNLIHTNHRISRVRGHHNETNEIHDTTQNESETWSEDGEKNGENRIVSKRKPSTAVITIMKGGKTAYILVDDLEIEEIQTRIKIATTGSMREKFGSYIFFKH